MNAIKKAKDKLYFKFVERNPIVKEKYQGYVNENPDYHKKHRLRSWMYMFALNVAYGNRSVEPKPPSNVKNSTKKQVKPAIPESLHLSRLSPVQFARQLLQYDVISFDIFDTLIFRPIESPADLFFLVGCKLSIPDFKQVRCMGETRARELTTKPNKQVNIYDIYAQISLFTGLDSNVGVDTEVEVEKDLCIANPYMKTVFDILKYNNKTIVATSDMYLPKEIMRDLLMHVGYYEFDEIFVSCDHYCGKHDGELQRIVQLAMGTTKRYVHIGDNFPVDIQSSRKFGWDAIHYPNVNEVGRCYRPQMLETISSSVYKGLVNAHIHNGMMNHSRYYQHGFIYGGILVCGYCQWLNNLAKEKNIDLFLFVSRDGDILYKVYSRFFKQVDAKYVVSSRFSASRLTMDKFAQDYITCHIKCRAFWKDKVTIRQCFAELDLDILVGIAQKDGFDIEQQLNEQSFLRLNNFFYQYIDEVKHSLLQEQEAAICYLRSVIGNHKRICIVDIGWRGTGLVQLKHTIESIPDCDVEVFGALAGVKAEQFADIPMATEMLSVYLFSKTQNLDLLTLHNNSSRILKNMVVEILFSAPHPSFLRYKDDDLYSLSFAAPEVKNYQITIEMQRGIHDFIELYLTRLGDYIKYIDINPYTAYLPLNNIIGDNNYIYTLFKDFQMTALSGRFDEHRVTTIGEIIKGGIY